MHLTMRAIIRVALVLTVLACAVTTTVFGQTPPPAKQVTIFVPTEAQLQALGQTATHGALDPSKYGPQTNCQYFAKTCWNLAKNNGSDTQLLVRQVTNVGQVRIGHTWNMVFMICPKTGAPQWCMVEPQGLVCVDEMFTKSQNGTYHGRGIYTGTAEPIKNEAGEPTGVEPASGRKAPVSTWTAPAGGMTKKLKVSSSQASSNEASDPPKLVENVVTVELWTMPGCGPCIQLEQAWPELKERAKNSNVRLIRHDHDGRRDGVATPTATVNGQKHVGFFAIKSAVEQLIAKKASSRTLNIQPGIPMPEPVPTRPEIILPSRSEQERGVPIDDSNKPRIRKLKKDIF